MAQPVGETESDALRLDFHRRLKLEFPGAGQNVSFRTVSKVHSVKVSYRDATPDKRRVKINAGGSLP
ncbi:MAG: hypothetical protein AB7F41_07265 [Methylocystis sp.]|uniref:hypothetical protein n=1 Tax=Methylocystis sp. TaxID=1911079 RepID=UPI003D121CFB